jgi:FkbH-like protein
VSARRCVIVSDFTIDALAGYLSNDAEEPAIEAVVAPYGDVRASLLSAARDTLKSGDIAVVWTRPEAVIPSYAHLLAGEHTTQAALLADVAGFAGALLHFAQRAALVLVPAGVSPPAATRGLFGSRAEGSADALREMNLELARRLRARPSAFTLDPTGWLLAGGRRAFATKAWYLGKIPFSNDVFKEAARDIKAALRAVSGQARKLLLLDADDTLWGGLVGEEGWQQLRVGGHDAAGEAYLEFQRRLVALAARGVLIGIVSKNDENAVMEALASHPEMALRREQLAGWRINWSDKAKNVAELAAELNIGLDAVVFIDESPAERDRVRNALPHVLVPDWPADPLEFPAALDDLRCFDAAALTGEDRLRARHAAVERQRDEQRRVAVSYDDWLRELDVHVDARPLDLADAPRAAQLLNKTNQLNLATRRLTEAQLLEWAAAPGRHCWTFRVSDRFGDYGLTGLASVQLEGDSGVLTDFLLSCRAMGRGVEQAMLATVLREAQRLGARKLFAQFRQTSRNAPCLEFLRSTSAVAAGDGKFSYELARRKEAG